MLQKILDFIFPRRCVICDSLLKRNENKICRGCKTKVTVVTEPICKHCGKPIIDYEDEFCFDCKGKSFYSKRGFAVWIYDKYMKHSISQFKYANRREYVDYYVEEVLYHLGSRLFSLDVDALIPVPIHKEKLRFRGFNQAELLANEIGEKLKVPVFNHIISRKKNTKPQKGLDSKERYQNLKHAFIINKKGKEYCKEMRRVLLVDDIYTTGATIEACAGELVRSGIKEVYFVCLCIGKDF